MENVINSLPSKVSPVAMAAGAPEGLKTGHLSVAFDLVEMYAPEATDGTRVQKLSAMANEFTCEEFKQACKDAQKKASEADTLSGFKAQEGAKGQDQYGPVRRVLNQRLSEAKNLFGVFKMSPDILKEKGYVPALNAARAFLKEVGKKWDGSIPQTDDQKALKAEQAAYAQVMAANPRNEGEDKAAWLERIEDETTTLLELAKEEAFNKGVNRAYEKLQKELGKEVLKALVLKVVDDLGLDDLETLQHYVQEEIIIQTIEAKAA